MSERDWYGTTDRSLRGRGATMTQVIQAIEWSAPATKDALADEVEISTQYLSELLQELKANGLVRKAYVVDRDAVYANTEVVTPMTAGDEATGQGAGEASTTDSPDTLGNEQTRSETDSATADTESGSGEGNSSPGESHRRLGETDRRQETVLALLDRLETVTREQYNAARTVYFGADPDPPPTALESLTNERCSAVLAELKSYTLTTDWPGNRIASDLATIATNLEIVGDRACFIADAVDRREGEVSGIVANRVEAIFAAGTSINGHFRAILFDRDLERYENLLADEEDVHRDLDELFELITTYDPTIYGYLVGVTRALERSIYYWVHAAEVAVRLHSGLEPRHLRV